MNDTSTAMLSSDSANKATWAYLPPEIRLIILEKLLQHGCSVACAAAVSREWQAVIEPHNFAHIKLTLSRLNAFDSMTRRNRARIEKLWLCIELHQYRYTRDAYTNMDNYLIRMAFQNLFSTLRTWEPNEKLVLDISVFSASDFRAGFEYLTVEPDHTPNEGAPTVAVEQAVQHRPPGRSAIQNMFQLMLPNELPHQEKPDVPDSFDLQRASDWEDSRFSRPLDLSRESDLEDLLYDEEMDWPSKLPSVPAITGVLLRQQTRRRWMPDMLSRLFERLPRLQDFHYEPWRAWGSSERNALEMGMSISALSSHDF
jgi:hypothetical protein